MANTTVYPFGTGGTLPGGVSLVDYTVGGWDKALAAEAGKELYQMMLEETDIYAKINPRQEYKAASAGAPGYAINESTGEVQQSAYTEQFVNEFPIDLVNKNYLASYGYGGVATTSGTLHYYDSEWNHLGSAYSNPEGEDRTSLSFAELVYPSAWLSDLDTFKATAKYIRIVGFTGLRNADLYDVWSVPQSILPQDATPGTLYLFASVIRSPKLEDGINNSTQIVTTEVASPWGIIFPSTYNKVGTPTPVVAMLHGAEGYVSNDCLGYTYADWITWRNQYLSAGFAVMDINGTGASTLADSKSKHFGNPLSIETLDKAFDFLRENFNIADKILLHGNSMGGCLALNYAKVFPGKVSAVACTAPVNLPLSIRFEDSSTRWEAWGYSTKEEAVADGLDALTGYVPLNECEMVSGDGTIKKVDWSAFQSSADALAAKMVDYFPVQLRVWQGTNDQSVSKESSALLVESLRRGNSPASIRYCNGATHSLMSYAYVRDEVVDYFKRFVNKIAE